MKKAFKRTLSLILALTLLIGTAVILPASAKKDEGAEEQQAAVGRQSYAVVADCGVITPKYGKLENGKAKEGAVMTIALDETAAAGHTFRYWKSAYGDKVPDLSFEVYVDRDVYFYPVFSDVKGGFGKWELLTVGDCTVGDIYVRTHSELGFKQYKLVRYNYGEHDYHYEFVDDDTCRAVCSHCGDTCDEEHWFDEGTVIQQPTAEEDGVIEYTCERCGGKVREAIDAGEAPAHEHNWVTYGAEILQEAEDGQPGIRRVHCSECGATKDVWYIKAEWEKYYFGNHVFFDTSDSLGLWGTADEHHYSFVNDEGYHTYVYAVREDYRDNDQCWELMWIDHADELGRKPLYVAKSKGQDEYNIYQPYSWAVIDYDIQTVDQYIAYIDHITTGDDRYSSSFFDNVKRYEELYNQQMFPADGPSDFLANMNGAWVYENDGSLSVDSDTGIAYYDIMFSDRREFLHIDPLTNCVILRYEPNSSSRWSQIKKIQPIVTSEEYDAVIAAFPAVEITPAPDPYGGDVIDGHGESDHNYGNYYQQTTVNEQYHKCTCSVCGKELYEQHTMSVKVPHLDFDDLTASTATYYCPICGYEEERPYLLTTAGIKDDLYYAFRNKSTRNISLQNDVLHTPSPVNFQLRVDPSYLVGGPDDSTYASGHGGYNRYYSKGYAAAYAYTYDGAQNDYFAFGVIRAGDGYPGYARVQLKAPSNDHYTFLRWELYDWATGTWQLFSADPTPAFNDVTTLYDDQWNEIGVSDTRVHDLTILRAVCEYVEPVRYAVTVVGGTFYASYESWDQQRAEGTVDADAMIYLSDDNDAPAGKLFDHFDVYDADNELIGTTDGWGYTVDRDGLVFRAAYVDMTYWVGFDAENGYVYLIDDGSEQGGDKDKEKPGEITAGDDDGEELTEYWGGEYPAGAVITVTTASYDDEEYPYFLGWYYITYDEMGEDRDLLTADRELTVTVEAADGKSGYGSYRAIWSDEADPVSAEDAESRVVRVTDGFASVRRYQSGLYLSCVCAPYYCTVSFMDDPGAFISTQKWTLTGTFDDETAFYEEIEDDFGCEYWFEGEGFAPAVVYAGPVGESTLVFADSDGDGDVTINDATRIQRVLAAIDDDTYGRADLSCDLSGNGTVDIVDATLIQRYLAGYEIPNQDLVGWVIVH